MNKKIIIGISIGLVIILGLLGWLLFANSDNDKFLTKYTISTDAANGSFKSYLVEKSNKTEISPELINNYLITSFNSPRDILWINCVEGYTASDIHSTTSSHILSDPFIGSGMEIIEGKNNNFTLTCNISK